VSNKRVQTEMWAFALPLWAYIPVGFSPMGFFPMGFCSTLAGPAPAARRISLLSVHPCTTLSVP